MEQSFVTFDEQDAFEKREAVRSAIKRLSPGLRVVIERIFLDGQSGQEVAADLGISSQAVSQRKLRGMRALRNDDVLSLHA